MILCNTAESLKGNDGAMKINIKKVISLVLVITLIVVLFPVEYVANAKDDTLEGDLVTVAVSELSFARGSRTQIVLGWKDTLDPLVDTYIIYRRNTINSVGTGEWSAIGKIKSDRTANGTAVCYVDQLKNANPQQYEYTVGVTVADPNTCVAGMGKTIIASNIKICIDPGHYEKANLVGGSDRYSEGDFTMFIAAALYKELLKYGIQAEFTRTTGHISLGGYVDEELDKGHIKLRGEYAYYTGCDLFVSLHTNSNGDNAHGYPTFSQPVALNHPLVIVNTVAMRDSRSLNIANSIGSNLVNENYKMKIATTRTYAPASVGNVPGWSNTINDGLNVSGITLCRLSSSGKDYYGVLRGSSSMGVPGMIIEHGFHSIPEVRRAAAGGNLDDVWGKADAYGIAYGYGFVTNITY